MCVIAFSFAQSAEHLVLLSNRDEFFSRPTLSAHWWLDHAHVFGGRDERGGGSWLAASRRGRLAAVTNFRSGQPGAGPRSRGELVAGFLAGDDSIEDFARRTADAAPAYAGFNLLLFDFSQRPSAWYVSNSGVARALGPGCYGLSNDRLESPWPKVERLKLGLEQALSDSGDMRRQRLFDALCDRIAPPSSALPDSGLDPVRERYLAPVFIGGGLDEPDPLGGYGTRASTVIEIDANSALQFTERSWRVPGAPQRGYLQHEQRFTLA